MEEKKLFGERSFVFCSTLYEAIKRHEGDVEVQERVASFIIEYGLYGTLLDVSDIDHDGSLSKELAAIKEDMDARKAERERISKRENNQN